MHWLSIGLALLLSLAIIVIGFCYLVSPRIIARGFGLPLPEDGPNIAWWLRLKGVRDIVSGLAVLAVLVWGEPRMLGIILLVEAFIPLGDMLLVLAAKGSAKTAFGVHGATMVVMILAATPLIIGAS